MSKVVTYNFSLDDLFSFSLNEEKSQKVIQHIFINFDIEIKFELRITESDTSVAEVFNQASYS